MQKICLITENETSYKILDESFNNRYGDYLDVLLNKAGLTNENYVILNSEAPLQETQFAVIVTLGKTPTGLLLKLPKSFKMADHVGKKKGKVIPWYSLEHLFTRGKKLEQETIALLGKIKNELEST